MDTPIKKDKQKSKKKIIIWTIVIVIFAIVVIYIIDAVFSFPSFWIKSLSYKNYSELEYKKCDEDICYLNIGDEFISKYYVYTENSQTQITGGWKENYQFGEKIEKIGEVTVKNIPKERTEYFEDKYFSFLQNKKLNKYTIFKAVEVGESYISFDFCSGVCTENKMDIVIK